MSLEDVKAGMAHIDAGFVLFFFSRVCSAVMVRISSCKYVSAAPWVLSGRIANNCREIRHCHSWSDIPIERIGINQRIHCRRKNGAGPSVYSRLWTLDFLEGPGKMSSKGAKVEEVRTGV